VKKGRLKDKKFDFFRLFFPAEIRLLCVLGDNSLPAALIFD
jgi:hypothetical protein